MITKAIGKKLFAGDILVGPENGENKKEGWLFAAAEFCCKQANVLFVVCLIFDSLLFENMIRKITGLMKCLCLFCSMREGSPPNT